MGTWENNVIHINNEFQNLWLALVFGYRANLFCMYYGKKIPITPEKLQTTNQKEDLIKRKIVEMKTEQDNNNSKKKKTRTNQSMHAHCTITHTLVHVIVWLLFHVCVHSVGLSMFELSVLHFNSQK